MAVWGRHDVAEWGVALQTLQTLKRPTTMTFGCSWIIELVRKATRKGRYRGEPLLVVKLIL